MKKLICAVAAIGMVAGVATTASAMDFSIKGKYQVEGYYLDSADGSGFNPYDDEVSSDAAWVHIFQLKPTLKVNDKITMKSDIRFLKDTELGEDPDDGGTNMGIKERHVDAHKIYMEYMSPIGKFRIGRTPGGAWQGAYRNNPAAKDRIFWFPKMDKPWGSYVWMEKKTENDWNDDHSDADKDIYEACVYYTTKETRWALGYDFINDKTNSTQDTQYHIAKAYVKQSLADFWIEAEIEYTFGDKPDYDDPATEDKDIDTLAFMAAAGTSFDNLKVSALYFYASGGEDWDEANPDVENALGSGKTGGTGDGFNPYYILTGDHTGMLNSDEYALDTNMGKAGVHCIGVSADLAVSDKLTLHGALAYAMAENEDAVAADLDDDYGWEINLGAKYKLLDNLTYEARAGYFATGDFFGDIAEAAGTDEEDLMLLSHHLTMTF